MGNEEFLIGSYFVVAAICVCLGLAAYLCLRHPLGKIVDALPRKGWGTTLKKSFPASTLLMALAGFLSVRYSGCANLSYKNIVSDRSYMMTISRQQISETLSSIVLTVFIWGVVILLALVTIRQIKPSAKILEADSGHTGKRES
jgi:hypothetical protein